MSRASNRKQRVGALFRRSNGIETREVEGEIFLAAKDSGTIHHLDGMASAAWRALAEPKTAEQLGALFQAAFPAAPKRTVARDVANLLADLEDSRLISRVGKKAKIHS